MDSGRIIRFCLVGLPAGLMLLGIGSVMYTQLSGGPETEESEMLEKKSKAAGIMRKDINREDLERYVGILAGDIGDRNVKAYKNLRTAAFWIESTMGPSNMGYTVRKQKYEAGGEEVWNLVAELRGTSRSDEVVVIGAHYDTVPGCPGANDNGTGVAALLSLANAFSGTKNARTLQFVAFVNEEPPFFQTDLMGSVVYVNSLQNDGTRVAGMLALETIGHFSDEAGSQRYPDGLEEKFPGKANFIALVGNVESQSLLESSTAVYRDSGAAVPMIAGVFPLEIAGIGWSDHWSFWQAGYPALMVTDTAPFRYEHYHKPTDTPDRIDYERFTEVVMGLRAVVNAWANP